MTRMLVAVLLIPLGAACVDRQAPKDGRPAAPVSPIASTVAPSAPPSATPSVVFHGSAAPIDDATRARMSYSWRPGCPVALDDLRLLTLSYRGFDGKVHAGELVVHEDHAEALLGVFRELFAAGFPIRRMKLVDAYGGDDDRSMAANNTSAFNCRRSAGDASAWSQHSYGLAIDINPIQNPYVTKAGIVEPSAGARYADRDVEGPGVIRADDVVVRAFASIGWSWGGAWSSAKDYQHFSANGR